MFKGNLFTLFKRDYHYNCSIFETCIILNLFSDPEQIGHASLPLAAAETTSPETHNDRHLWRSLCPAFGSPE